MRRVRIDHTRLLPEAVIDFTSWPNAIVVTWLHFFVGIKKHCNTGEDIQHGTDTYLPSHKHTT